MLKHYIMHKGRRIYFEYGLSGFKEIQKYLDEHGLKKRKIYTEG